MKKVYEFSHADELARAHGYKVAAYGGTSRELLDFTVSKINNLGGTQNFEKWLSQQERIHLLDFHQIQSDLDVMLIPLQQVANDPKQILDELKTSFGGNVFYDKMDLNVSREFFKQYPPAKEHFEAISNIPISLDGVERLAELNTQVDGQSKNLAQWGLEQFANRRFEFLRNPNFQGDAYANFRQVLRWARYLSEAPTFGIDSQTPHEIKELLKSLRSKNKKEILDFLRNGHKEWTESQNRYSSKYRPGSPSAKIVEALDKLHIYSQESNKTFQMLKDLGIADIVREAGLYNERILKPLPLTGPPSGPHVKTLGHELVLNHRTTLSASQNIGRGAVWISDNKAFIKGKKTVAVHGDGLYAAPGIQSLSYGDFYVQITLSADAREGIDYVRIGNSNDPAEDWYVIKNMSAIARHPDGSLKISKPSIGTLFQDFLAKLRSTEKVDDRLLVDAIEKKSILRGLATLLTPESHPSEEKMYQAILHEAEQLGERSTFIRSFFNETRMSSLLDLKTDFAQKHFTEIVESLRYDSNPLRKLLSNLNIPEDSSHVALFEKYAAATEGKLDTLFWSSIVKDVSTLNQALHSPDPFWKQHRQQIRDSLAGHPRAFGSAINGIFPLKTQSSVSLLQDIFENAKEHGPQATNELFKGIFENESIGKLLSGGAGSFEPFHAATVEYLKQQGPDAASYLAADLKALPAKDKERLFKEIFYQLEPEHRPQFARHFSSKSFEQIMKSKRSNPFDKATYEAILSAALEGYDYEESLDFIRRMLQLEYDSSLLSKKPDLKRDVFRLINELLKNPHDHIAKRSYDFLFGKNKILSSPNFKKTFPDEWKVFMLQLAQEENVHITTLYPWSTDKDEIDFLLDLKKSKDRKLQYLGQTALDWIYKDHPVRMTELVPDHDFSQAYRYIYTRTDKNGIPFFGDRPDFSVILEKLYWGKPADLTSTEQKILKTWMKSKEGNSDKWIDIGSFASNEMRSHLQKLADELRPDIADRIRKAPSKNPGPKPISSKVQSCFRQIQQTLRSHSSLP